MRKSKQISSWIMAAVILVGVFAIMAPSAVRAAGKDTETIKWLQSEADKIVIPNANDIRGNITLPKESSEGVSISWTSDREDVISTTEKANMNYDSTPAGVVTRQVADKRVKLTATLKFQGESLKKLIIVTVKAKNEPITDKDLQGYFYTYFRGNIYGDGESQNIHLATSKDGLFWDDMNKNEPILYATLGTKGVRDSYIIRSPEGDRFYLIGTDLDAKEGNWRKLSTKGSKSMYIWESDDLVNWSEPRLIPIAPDNAGCMWAPEAIYDANTGEYIVYFASNLLDNEGKGQGNRIFYVKTRDFWTFTKPKLYKDRTSESVFIDTDMLEYNGTFYRFSKREPGSTILLEKSDKPLGDFTLVKNIIADETGVEGPGCIKLNGQNKFILYIDGYGGKNKGVGFFPLVAESPEDLDKGNFKRLGPTEFRMPTGPKHGCILPITEREYNAVIAKWGGS